MKKRIVSFFLALTMLLGLMSVGVYGAEGDTFNVTFLDVDSQTLATPISASDLRLQAATVGTNWKIDSAACGQYVASGTKYAARWQQSSAYAFLTLESARGQLALKFTAPSAGTYDVTANFQPAATSSDADIFINNVYVGTLTGKDPNGSHLIVKQQKLSGVTLLEGEYANSLVIKVRNGSIMYQGLTFTETSNPAKVSSLSATLESSSLTKGGTAQLSVSAALSNGGRYDLDAAGATVTYESTNESAATVSSTGLITAVGEGTATITAKATVDGNEISDTVDVIVTVPKLSEVSVSAPRYILTSNTDGEALSATAKMSDGADVPMANTTVTYTSLTEDIATVSASGIVSPVAEGTVQIKVSVTYENVTVDKTVEIPITAEPLPDGTAFEIDFGTYDKATTWPNGSGAYYSTATTKGDNWVMDPANTTCSYYTAGTKYSCRMQQFVTIARRDATTGSHPDGAFAIKFTVPETGIYDISPIISPSTAQGIGDIILIDGSKQTYIGTFDNYVKNGVWSDKTSIALQGISLTGGKEYSIAIRPQKGTIYLFGISFTPVHEAGRVPDIIATVESLLGNSVIVKSATGEIKLEAPITSASYYDLARDGEDAAVSFDSSDKSVATVDSSGIITGVDAGSSDITVNVTILGKQYTKTLPVTVIIPEINSVSATVPKYILTSDSDGEAIVPSAKMSDNTDVDIALATVEYTSLDTSVATVTDDGIIIPVKRGTAKINIKVTYNGKSAENTFDVSIVDIVPPEGDHFLVDFTTVDQNTLFQPSGYTKQYMVGTTVGANWAMDTNLTVSQHINGNVSNAVRLQVTDAYSFATIKPYGDFAMKFTAPSAGIYDVTVNSNPMTNSGYADIFINGVYVGGFDSNDSVSHIYDTVAQNLVGIPLLEGELANTIIIRPHEKNVYMQSFEFTPVYKASTVDDFSAFVDDDNLAAGESVMVEAEAAASNGAMYDLAKSFKKADGSDTNGISFVYSSENDAIATIAPNGKITAKIPGSTTITATATLPSGDVSKNIRITVNNLTFSDADMNVDSEKAYVVGGSQNLIPYAVLSDGSFAKQGDVSGVFTSNNDSVAKVENGKLILVSAGEADITASVTFNGTTKNVTKKITVENVKLAAITAKTEDNIVFALDSDGSKLVVTGILNNKETISLAGAMFTYESLTPDIVSVDSEGNVFCVKRGDGIIKVSAEINNETFECEASVISSSSKKEPTIYTYEMREQALKNAEKYQWARNLVKTATNSADYYVENLDAIYDLIPTEGIPRGYTINTKDFPSDKTYTCPHPDCGANLQEKYGGYSWVLNPLRNPWKVQCPECKRLFPSNDFASLYKLGINEDGVYDRDLALERNAEIVANGGEGYLVNKLYPELDENWLVDDGFGWSPEDGTYGTDNQQKWAPISLYHHYVWHINSGTAFLRTTLNTLRDAYLYTNNAKYGRAGAILLDRIADVYPAYDIQKTSIEYPNSHGGSHNSGKILGCIWEPGLAEDFVRAYDAFYPMMEDSRVIEYLSAKAVTVKGVTNPKTSAELIRENAENGILREVFAGTKRGQLWGNFGMHQNTLALAAAALDTYPETGDMINWLGGFSAKSYKDIKEPIYGDTVRVTTGNSGGEMLIKYVADVDRDGFGNEVGVGYNAIWLTNGLNVAETLYRYGAADELNLFKNPKYVKMFGAFVKETVGNGYTLHIGDSGRTAGPGISNYGSYVLRAFNMLKTPELAKLYYFYQDGKLDEVYIDIFTDNDSLKTEIQALVDKHGKYELSSDNLTGFGLAVLRGGALIKGATSSTSSEQRYDTWIYYGKTGGHGHYDALQLGIDAYGFNFTPDLGYPETAGYEPNRFQWVSNTLAHNTVVVDENWQSATNCAHPLHFDSTTRVKLFDIDQPKAYPKTDIYRRTAVTIEASEKDAYTIDFFRIKGGNEHTYSFHTQSYMGYTVDGLNLVPQVDDDGNYVGSYAGADVPYGPDPNTVAGTSALDPAYPRGYTWLENVNRAENIEDGTFTVNFKQTDFNKAVSDSKGLNLKFFALNDWTPTGVGLTTGYAPRTVNNKNIPGLDYMLIHRENNESELDTLYTSLIEPYKGEEYISSATYLNTTVKEGYESTDDVVKAVKVSLKSGRTDYVVYATNNEVIYNITDGDVNFDFRGFVGVYSVNADGKNIYSYVNDGDIIGNISTEQEYTGQVVTFTKEFTDKNTVTVKFDSDVDVSNLPGRYIYIEPTGSLNASYKILGATQEGNNVVLDLGDVSLVSGFLNNSNLSLGYTYNIAEKKAFSIPLSYVADDAPVFDEVAKNLTASAESLMTMVVTAESVSGDAVEYVLKTAPRGAGIDSETGKITWKPSSAQVGENGFVVAAIDKDGRESTTSFEVTVYGSTSGGSGGESGSTGSGSGSGNGGTGTPSVPSDDKEDNDKPSTNVPDAPSTDGSKDDVRFVDLGNHAWAEDSINALADAGIIKGTSEDTFSPAKNITRADFAILLVRAFEKTSDNTENFADVSETDYFAKELAIARNTGLVGGIGNNKFAPRESIKRCDMMLMVYRVLKSEGVEFEIGDVDMPDIGDVPEYAHDAVSALIGAGLVNGKNGKIAPNDNTTRAEVAVLLKRVLDFAANK